MKLLAISPVCGLPPAHLLPDNRKGRRLAECISARPVLFGRHFAGSHLDRAGQPEKPGLVFHHTHVVRHARQVCATGGGAAKETATRGCEVRPACDVAKSAPAWNENLALDREVGARRFHQQNAGQVFSSANFPLAPVFPQPGFTG